MAEELNVHGDRSRFARAPSREAFLAGAAAFTAAGLVAALGLRAGAERPQPDPTRAPVPVPKSPAGGTVRIQLLGVNDFHGNLEPPPPRRAGRRKLGGAAWLDSHLRRAAGRHPGRTIRVHAGDMAGATPLISSHFHDEPAMEAMNLMDFDVGTLGNHEFDEGGAEMLRLIRGGQRADGHQFKHDASGSLVNTSDPGYAGARFPYVSANTVRSRDGSLLLPPYKIVERAGVKVGFIGVTTDSAPEFLLPEHSRFLRFLDISTAVNRYVPELRRRGVESIVVLAHSGAYQRGPRAARGEIIDETRQMSDAVDVVLAGHTQVYLNTLVPGERGSKLVVQGYPYGTAYERLLLDVDRRTGDVVKKHAEVIRTRHGEVAPDPRSAALVRRYRRRLGGLASRVVAVARRPMRHVPPGDGPDSTNLGETVADAQRRFARADVALVNPGNLRGSLAAGPVTYPELFRVHAYEHPVWRMVLTGSEIRAVLEEQFDDEEWVLLHASGLSYERDGERITEVRLGRRALDPRAKYTVAVNGILADGHRFPTLRDHGRRRRKVGTDLEALVAWLERGPAGFR